MERSALSEKLSSTGIHQGEYRGGETALVFSDSKTEFTALRQGCGVYDLGWRSKYVIAGRDRVRWLNGMVTNNVRDLGSGQGVYCFVLNPQGRILGDLYVYNLGEHFLVDTDASQAEKLYTQLKHFIIMDQVDFKAANDQWTAIGVQGPKSEEILRAAGREIPQLEALQFSELKFQDSESILLRGDDPKTLRYELWTAPANAGRLWGEITRAGATPVGSEALEIYRITVGIPTYGQDIHERDLPQETEQQRALSFTKGCYIGQEIVERIRSRGKVHRGLTGFRIQGPLPSPGSKVQADGKDVGEITSAAVIPSSNNGDIGLALGYIRREAAGPGTIVQIGDAKASVQPLPFEDV